MNERKPKNCAKTKKLICDWSEKKIYWVHYRLLKFYVRLGTIVPNICPVYNFI